ncbi:beta-1,3-endoglucanase [Hirsutella rhossiliensis]|uniref:Beta-1,3-endoglucanase n=1 Tax=Hirsutella rhossiliensis TaxID=111463 RepID=A0A9P8N8I6_9HYPO|nr:beta-1,3-endoglucanase [Hirsutella rhossiliensis]KAH0968497.1 beta-1,3-endoglucanase [Hirsutella rhossiliensis]
MAPALLTAVSVLLALAGDTSAKSFQLAETIDKDNFFSKFDFLTKGRGHLPFDDNGSFVRYQDKTNARKKNITRIQPNGDIYLGVDHENVIDPTGQGGRDTFRIESQKSYKHGLFIARFSHLPRAVCGTWPAFWTLGDGAWPSPGEIDLYEGWNLNTYNKPTIHVGTPSEVGNCNLDLTEQGARVLAQDCDNIATSHASGQGCQTEEKDNSIWASSTGGIQALLWTNDEIKIYTWPHGTEPDKLDEDEIDTDSWTNPSMHLRSRLCNIDKAFQSQKIMFDIAFCGNPAGTVFWNVPDHVGEETCHAKTKGLTCEAFVAENPSAFKDVNFQIRDIRYFELKPETKSLGSLAMRILPSPAQVPSAVSHPGKSASNASRSDMESAGASTYVTPPSKVGNTTQRIWKFTKQNGVLIGQTPTFRCRFGFEQECHENAVDVDSRNKRSRGFVGTHERPRSLDVEDKRHGRLVEPRASFVDQTPVLEFKLGCDFESR